MANYNSGFTGAQMDAVFRRVSNMQIGEATITASTKGLGYAYVNADPGLTGAVALGCVAEQEHVRGEVYANVSYNSTTGQVFATVTGDGVTAGEWYLVRWLLIA